MRSVQRSSKARLFASRVFAAGALSLAVLGAGVVSTGCKSNKDASTDMSKPLYDRLGGEPAITKVVDSFIGYAEPDKELNFNRVGTPHEWQPTTENVAKLRKHLIQFFSMATDGPKTYEGKGMLEVHTGMQITEAQWGAAVADLKKALEVNGVTGSLEDEVIAKVAPTHDQIVGH